MFGRLVVSKITSSRALWACFKAVSVFFALNSVTFGVRRILEYRMRFVSAGWSCYWSRRLLNTAKAYRYCFFLINTCISIYLYKFMLAGYQQTVDKFSQTSEYKIKKKKQLQTVSSRDPDVFKTKWSCAEQGGVLRAQCFNGFWRGNV